MNYESQAGKNFLWLLIAQIFARISGAVFFIFLAFRLGDLGIGQYGFIASFVPFWFILPDFGAGSYLYREWSKGNKKIEEISRDFNILLTSRFLIVIILFFIFLFYNYFFNKEILFPLILYFLTMSGAQFVSLTDSYLQSTNLFKPRSLREVFEKIISIFVGAILILIWPRVVFVFLALLLSQIFAICYYYFKYLPIKIKFVFDFHRVLELFKYGLPFLLINIFTSLYARIDTVMLRHMKDFQTVGWYTTAYKFLDLSAILPVLFIGAIFPLMSKLYHDSNLREQFYQFFNRCFRIILSMGFLITLFFFLFAPEIINIFFPASFAPAVLATRILMIAQAIGFFSLFLGNFLIIQQKEKKSVKVIIFCTFLNIVLNLLLIPRFSLYGAAWATVLAEIVNLILLIFLTKAILISDRKTFLKFGIIFLMDIFLILLLKASNFLSQPFFVTLIFLLNILLLIRFNLFNKSDFELFFQPIRLKLSEFLWKKK